ncbi:fumarylacetoacetate hydrolase family protein [Okibacterium endophyticum]
MIESAARRLREASRTGVPCAPVRDLIGDDEAQAYRVQQVNVQRDIARGAVRAGRKIGLTSEVAQAQLGVDHPDYGVLFAHMDRSESAVVSLGELIQPRLEGEIAFRLAKDIDRQVRPDEVAAYLDSCCAAFEIVDSRIAGWEITLADTVADNGSAALYLLGQRRLSDIAVLDGLRMTIEADGIDTVHGQAEASLGDPRNAVAWLANKAVAHGDPLRAGEVVLSGSLGALITVDAPGRYRASFDALGTIDVEFVSP